MTEKSLDEQIQAAIAEGSVSAVKELIEQARAPLASQLEELSTERDRYRNQLHSEKVGRAFSQSSFLAQKVSAPTDMMAAMFGKHFSVADDGSVVPIDADGNPTPSRVNFGGTASFEEAIEAIVNAYPNKDALLKKEASPTPPRRPDTATPHGHTGAKTLTRAQFEALGAHDQMARMKEGYRLVDA